jgi:phosphatidate phosphatase APP1
MSDEPENINNENISDADTNNVNTSSINTVNLVVFHGYGTPRRLYLSGRVLRNAPDVSVMGAGVLRNLAAAFNRLDSNELPNITVRATYRDESWETTSDEEGYFAFEIEPESPLTSGEMWHDLAVTWQHPAEDASGAAVTARVLTPPPTATFGVISDVDDTILRSYITSVVKMALEMLLKNAYSRVTFPGVPAFYRALHAGAGVSGNGSDNNPIFYVSLSPWNLYSLLTQFLEINDIPRGPLILRDYGLQTLTSFGGPSPKRKLIQDLLDMYPELPFVLLGDSGQHDPEIYAEVVYENPNRIKAVYIRDVSGGTDADRAQEVAALAAATQACGVDMLLSPHTRTFATHAAALGMIQPLAVEEVEADEEDA